MNCEHVPLFPLNTVLLPHMPLRLHVFEERYKRMINGCIDAKTPFGVVLIREGEEVGGSAVPEAVGCLARIIAVQRLDEGRMNLFAEGTERFRLLDYVEKSEEDVSSFDDAGTDQGAGGPSGKEARYIVGFTELVDDEPDSDRDSGTLVSDIFEKFDKYFQILVDFAGVRMPEYELPRKPMDLSFVIAAVVQMDNAMRQRLLEMQDTRARLELEVEILDRELARLSKMTRSKLSVAEKIDTSNLQSYFSRN